MTGRASQVFGCGILLYLIGGAALLVSPRLRPSERPSEIVISTPAWEPHFHWTT